MLETLLREMDEEGGDDSAETVVHDNEQARRFLGVRRGSLARVVVVGVVVLVVVVVSV